VLKKPDVVCTTFDSLKAAVQASWPPRWGAPTGAINHIVVTYEDPDEVERVEVDCDSELAVAIGRNIWRFHIELPGAGGPPPSREC
jgi:hypothetical protein